MIPQQNRGAGGGAEEERILPVQTSFPQPPADCANPREPWALAHSHYNLHAGLAAFPHHPPPIPSDLD